MTRSGENGAADSLYLKLFDAGRQGLAMNPPIVYISSKRG